MAQNNPNQRADQGSEEQEVEPEADEPCTPYEGSPGLSTALHMAQLRVGNAAAGGLYEQSTGAQVGHQTWTVVNGFLDTNFVTVELVVEKTGTGSLYHWTVGSNTIASTGPAYSTISHIAVRAEVSTHPQQDMTRPVGQVRMKWQQVAVSFYDANNIESHHFGVNCSPEAELIDKHGRQSKAPGGGPRIRVLKATTKLFTPPTGFAAVRAVVSGEGRLISEDVDRKVPPSLGANQSVGRVYVFAT